MRSQGRSLFTQVALDNTSTSLTRTQAEDTPLSMPKEPSAASKQAEDKSPSPMAKQGDERRKAARSRALTQTTSPDASRVSGTSAVLMSSDTSAQLAPDWWSRVARFSRRKRTRQTPIRPDLGPSGNA